MKHTNTVDYEENQHSRKLEPTYVHGVAQQEARDNLRPRSSTAGS